MQARTWVICPGLQPGGRYADFNGNGKRRGRGYRLFGARGTGWLHKAGYPVPDDDRGRGESLRAFLTDLSGLAGRFGLIGCSIDPVNGEWLDLDAMVAVARLPGGWKPLDRVHLRVYAPSDYLERWRELLASGANFADLPRVAGTTAPDPVASPGWKTGLPALDLAVAVQRHNCRHRRVTRIIHGPRWGTAKRWVSRQVATVTPLCPPTRHTAPLPPTGEQPPTPCEGS